MNIFKALFGLQSPKVARPSYSDMADRHVADAQRYVLACMSAVGSSVSVEDISLYLGHSSGYVRQAALARCVQLGLPELLPAVVERVNDWVPEVRRAAQSALQTLAPFMPAPQWLAILPAVLKLLDARRVDHREWVTEFELGLVKQLGVQVFIQTVREGDIKLARACLHTLRRQGFSNAISPEAVISRAPEDIVLSFQAVLLCASLPAESQRAQYLAAIRSRFGAVRAMALRAVLSMPPHADNDGLAVSALFDTQPVVRGAAMTYLKTRNFDLPDLYRDELVKAEVSKKRTSVALLSLASLKSTADLPLVRSFATAPLISVRKAALLAWLRLDDNDKDAVALAALKDEAAGVRRFALRVVSQHGAFVPLDLVRSVLAEKNDPTLIASFSTYCGRLT